MHAFIRASEIFYDGGNLQAVLGKAITACSPFLITSNQTLRPYLPVPEETIAMFKRIAEDRFPDILWKT